MNAEGLTARELSCLLAVRSLSALGERPSNRRIAERLRASSATTAARLLDSLRRKGFVRRDERGVLLDTGAPL